MKFYKLNDTWVSWDELHNGYGYTTGPSIAVTYKSASNSSSWGEDAGSGYYVGDIDDMVHGSFWCDSDYGWFEIDGLVWNPEIYPSNATSLMMQNGGITSPAVSLESDGVTYYLIKVIVADTGWITADEAAELGWEVYDEMQGTFIVFDTVENKIVSAFTNELTYGEIEGIVLQSPKLVYGVDITVPTAQFWFSANGRSETENRALNTGNPLYTEDGVRLLPSTHSDYIGAVPLSFMEVDGDMFMADSDPENNHVKIVNDYLNLYIKPGIPIRDKSAWAVQFERVFTLSFANTQLPDITITLPSDETGHKGTSITLPTMSGEYESGGKTWTPSSWNIGAFGDSYTLNADTVAHLLFEEVETYEEITLYLQSGNKSVQINVTSEFVGDVNSTYCHRLYTDEACTIPWTGYDYSNEYEQGRYVDGVWTPISLQKVSDLPSSVGGQSYVAIVLLDTGCVWLVSNANYASTVTLNSITVRIYPKDQQYYAFYLSTSSVYNNSSISNGRISGLKGKPNISSAQTVPWAVKDATLPTRAIYKLLGSAGNEINQSGIDWRDPSLGYQFYQLANNSGASISLRAVVFSLSVPTEYCYSLNKVDTTVSYGGGYIDLYDGNGNAMLYDDACQYRVIGVFKANGDASTDSWATISYLSISKKSDGTARFSIMNNQTLTFSKVWYIKTIEVNFGDPVTIPAGYHVESVKCQRLYVKASNVSYSAGNPVTFSFLGENEFCDDSSKSLVGTGVSPCLSIYAISSSVPDPVSGYWMSYRSTTTPSKEVFSISASNLNSGGVFVEGTLSMTNGDADNSIIANALNTYPALFRRYDSNNTVVPYYFKIQQSLWQLQNGVFSWLGDTTDASDLAYWYNGLAVQIILAKDE